jgi:uncharacterized protein (TIGR02300 family)
MKKQPELGKFHVCPHCGAKYFDLKKQHPTCPRCGAVDAPKATVSSRREEAAPAVPRAPRNDDFVEEIVELDELEADFDGELDAELDGDFSSVSAADDDFGGEEEEEI